MDKFNFIRGDEFRASLESDYEELSKAIENHLWKSAHVIAGSIIEAVLVDTLIEADYEARTKNNPLKMDLFQLIEICQKEDFLSLKSAGLSNVIREYRNLIHPGRAERLKEKVDKNTANVVYSLVEMIIGEISEKRSKTQGFTAEQIVSKIERDASAISIIGHLLRDTKPNELKRLLLNVLPERYNSIPIERDFLEEIGPAEGIETDRILSDLIRCYWEAFNRADESMKKEAVKNFVGILKQESQGVVYAYETAFFKSNNLKYLSQNEAQMVKEHLLARLKNEGISLALTNTLAGIGKYINKNETNHLLDSLIRAYLSNIENEIGNASKNLIVSEFYQIADTDIQEIYLARIDEWIEFLRAKGKHVPVEKLIELRSTLDVYDIPF